MPEQSGSDEVAVLSATIVLRTFSVPANAPTPPANAAVLPAIVLALKLVVIVPIPPPLGCQMPPPVPVTLLPLMVLLVMFTVRALVPAPA